MKRWFLLPVIAVAGMIGFGIYIQRALQPTPSGPAFIPHRVASPAEIEALIDALPACSMPADNLAMARFLPVTEPTDYVGDYTSLPQPPEPEPLRQLVAIGQPALPYLIDHLSDSRSTHIVYSIQRYSIGSLDYRNEVDIRPYDRVSSFPSIAEPGEGQSINGGYLTDYTFKVGDLCFLAIGQIVNRRFDPLTFQWTAVSIINSPVEDPAIVKAVQAEWSGTTSVSLENSLTRDLFDPDDPDPGVALVRLCYYYPPEGNKDAKRLLQRPIINFMAVFDFVNNDLINAPHFQRTDITDPNRFIVDWKHPETKAQAYLVGKLPPYDNPPTNSNASDVKADFAVEQLDSLTNGRLLYDPNAMSQVKFRPATLSLLRSKLIGYDVIRANILIVEDVFDDCLVKHIPDSNTTPSLWKSRLSAFLKDNGPQYKYPIFALLNVETKPPPADELTYGDVTAKARQIEMALFPGKIYNGNAFYNAATPDDQAHVVDAIQPFANQTLDPYVVTVLNQQLNYVKAMRHVQAAQIDQNYYSDSCECGFACVVYLAGRGQDKLCLDYCRQTLREAKAIQFDKAPSNVQGSLTLTDGLRLQVRRLEASSHP